MGRIIKNLLEMALKLHSLNSINLKHEITTPTYDSAAARLVIKSLPTFYRSYRNAYLINFLRYQEHLEMCTQ